LESLGHQVLARTTSVEALEVYRTRPHGFDTVVTDYTMPKMTGEGLAREVLQICPDIPIIPCKVVTSTLPEP
jgi:CheY-like chemotaxis protein